MPDFLGLMKQATELKSKMEGMQAELDRLEGGAPAANYSEPEAVVMPAVAAGPEIERLIQLLARLPGLGPRSARRAALFLIKKRELIMAPLAGAVQTAMERISICKVCGNIDTPN